MIKIANRNSSFELLRLIAQYMIVVYHILLFWFINNGSTNNPEIFKAICIPLHIGVILYVLISGFFGIRFSIKGIFRLIAYLFIYGLVFLILDHVLYGDKFGLKGLFFISNTNFWYVKTYLMLYLVAPIVNKVTLQLTTINRFILMAILAWMSCYVGLLGFDFSLAGGKNLVHFILLYLIGNTLYLYKDKINRISLGWIVGGYIFINFLSVFGYILCIDSTLEGISYSFVFKYNSIALILNAVCFFIPFMRLNIKSSMINYLASSCLAIYLIHSSILFMNHIIKNAALYIQTLTDNVIMIMLMVCILALIITLGCIVIDRMLHPVWKLTMYISSYLNRTIIGKYATKWVNL